MNAVEKGAYPENGAISKNLIHLMDMAEKILRDRGEEFSYETKEIHLLRERLSEGKFHLAVLGQFKRGKSTLLNALLGDDILPTSVVPLTAIPTFLCSGKELLLKIHFENEKETKTISTLDPDNIRENLSKYVTESRNPKNELHVSYVELFHPSPVLSNGLLLIDTPGVGSTFLHNTEVTLNFLSKCDAALFVVSVDPPLTAAEVDFLKEVKGKVKSLFFVLNKIDYLAEEEKAEAIEFLKTVLIDQVGLEYDVKIFPVSARQGLTAQIEESSKLWEQSGMKMLKTHLVEFLAREKINTLAAAITMKVCEHLNQVSMHGELLKRSLVLPIADLEERLKKFDHYLQEIETERVVAEDLLTGDRKRTLRMLEGQSEKLRKDGRNHINKRMREVLSKLSNKELSEKHFQQALSRAVFEFFEPKMNEMTEYFDSQVSATLTNHRKRLEEIISKVRKTAAKIFEIPYIEHISHENLTIATRPSWITHKWSSTLSPISPGVIDKIFPPSIRKKRILKRIMKQVEEIVINNVENLRWSVYQSINQTFFRFASELDQHLAETLEATHGAIKAAIKRRKEHGKEIANELEKVKEFSLKIDEIRTKIGCIKVSEKDVK